MLFAIDKQGEKIRAAKDAEGWCPGCSDSLIAKCGEIKIWHWAHYAHPDCDEWYGPMSEWHYSWQEKLPNECVEVKIIKGDKWHRADYQRKDGLVVEFQNSTIGMEDIWQREKFYHHMIWVFNCIEPYEENRLRIYARGYYPEASNYHTFRWYYPRKSIFESKKLSWKGIWLDLGDSVFRVYKAYKDETPFGGWGYRVGYDKFLDYLINGHTHKYAYSWQVADYQFHLDDQNEMVPSVG